MNSRSIQAVLRSLAKTAPSQSDAELLRKFVSERDERAFTALVHRHGRLVWAVCRHLTRSDADADDAFQATFLVLIRNAAKVRDPSKLSSWLHGVANKICAKARESGKRRVAREQASASHQHNGDVVADSAWDRALAVVHEEVAGLPEKLRTPFVLCCLEGKSVTDAADQLGCKLSAMSARLVRAKNALQARLEARGLTVCVAAVAVAVTAGSANFVPAAVLVKSARWVHAGSAIPDSILQLSQGVMTMSVSKMKFLAAGVFVACSLGLGGVRWVANADAQDGSKPVQTKPSPLLRGAAQPLPVQPPTAEGIAELIDQGKRVETAVGRTTRWDYDFVLASDMGTSQFIKFLQDRESRGWEFNGEVTLQHDGRATAHWAFRRPAAKDKAATNDKLDPNYQLYGGMPIRYNRDVIEKEIARLKGLLNQANDADDRQTQSIQLNKANEETMTTLIELLKSPAAQRFGADNLKFSYDPSNATIVVNGPPEAVKWAIVVIGKLYANEVRPVRP